MRNLLNISMLLLFLVAMTSCPGPKEAEPENTAITANELADYYLIAEHKSGGNRLVAMSFVREGNIVKASAHLQGGLRVHEATVENSIFRFDYNTNGESLYTFTLRKEANGTLQLQSYDFTYKGVPGQLSQAVLVKKSEALPIMNKTFWIETLGFKLEMEGNQTVLQWIDGKRYASYTLDNYGFKTNKDEFMGVVVPNWNFKGTILPGMLVETGDQVMMGVMK